MGNNLQHCSTVDVDESDEDLRGEDTSYQTGSFVSPDAAAYTPGGIFEYEGRDVSCVAVDRLTSTIFYKTEGRARQDPIGVFFDFDGTLTVSLWVERLGNYAVSDESRRHVMDALTPDEVVINFGGNQRLRDLQRFLSRLAKHDATLMVVSHGLVQVIVWHLMQVGLFEYFDCIFGSDSPELQKYGSGDDSKARLIQDIMETNEMESHRTWFCDDTHGYVIPVQETSLCNSVYVGKGGLSRVEMDHISSRLGISKSGLPQNLDSVFGSGEITRFDDSDDNSDDEDDSAAPSFVTDPLVLYTTL